MKRVVHSLILVVVLAVMPSAATYARDKSARTEAEDANSRILHRLIEFEQNLNDRIENLQKFATINDVTIDPLYRPEAHAVFKLWTVLVPENELTIINTNGFDLNSRFVVEKDGVRYYKFIIHPLSRNAFLQHLPEGKYHWQKEFEAMALASYRSLVAWNPKEPDKPFQIKVSLDSVIGSNSRMLSRRQIEWAATTSYLINSLNRDEYAKQGILFLDEPVGIYLKNFQFGYSLREPITAPGNVEYIPMFSLYARSRGQPSLLAQMIQRSGLPPREYVRRYIILPMVSHIFHLAFSEGIYMEAHEQNTLAEVRDGQLTGRFMYRDLGGFVVNERLRRAAGKDMSFIPKDFQPAPYSSGRQLITYLADYYIDSNFYALRNGLAKEFPSISSSWIKGTTRHAMQAHAFLRTGTWAGDTAAMTAAITNYLNASNCAMFLNPGNSEE